MRRRAALIGLAAAALILISAVPALAAAGGGTSGFGGGGGGGRGGGAGLFILFQLLIRLAIFGHGLGALIIIGAILIYAVLHTVMPKAQAARAERERRGRSSRRRVKERSRRTELAAAEAAEEDPAFAPDRVKPAAAQLFTQVQQAWSSDDRARLSSLVAGSLLAEWTRRLDDFARRGWQNHVEIVGEPAVELVGLSRRNGDDRVVVRIEATLRDYVTDRAGYSIKRAGRLTETTKIREFWTLGRHQNRWLLLSIEQGAEGEHALSEALVPTPWSDEQSLRDEALVEQAAADALPDNKNIAEFADLSFDTDARAAALDLSLVDGRFSPDILAVSARRAISAWAEAIDGEDRALQSLADASAITELLHPGDPGRRTRLVVRGPHIDEIRITGFDAAATPPTMTVDVRVTGRRYIEDRATAATVAGSSTRTTTWSEHWTFALSGDAAQPWRLVAVAAPLATRSALR